MHAVPEDEPSAPMIAVPNTTPTTAPAPYHDSFYMGDGESQELQMEHALGHRGNNHESKTLRQPNNRWISCSKGVVCLVLMSSAALVGYFAWFVLSREETDDFQRQFATDASEVLQGSQRSAQLVGTALHVFASLFASYAQYQTRVGAADDESPSDMFPNFTLPVSHSVQDTRVHRGLFLNLFYTVCLLAGVYSFSCSFTGL